MFKNNDMKNRSEKMSRNHFKFAIRRLSIGAASVLLGIGAATFVDTNSVFADGGSFESNVEFTITGDETSTDTVETLEGEKTQESVVTEGTEGTKTQEKPEIGNADEVVKQGTDSQQNPEPEPEYGGSFDGDVSVGFTDSDKKDPEKPGNTEKPEENTNPSGGGGSFVTDVIVGFEEDKDMTPEKPEESEKEPPVVDTDVPTAGDGALLEIQEESDNDKQLVVQDKNQVVTNNDEHRAQLPQTGENDSKAAVVSAIGLAVVAVSAILGLLTFKNKKVN